MRLDLFVTLKYQSSTIILSVSIKYSMRDIRCMLTLVCFCLSGRSRVSYWIYLLVGFYVLVFFLSVLVIPVCGTPSWPALWSTLGRTKNSD